MRISDWSSDVCSSDLDAGHARRRAGRREFHRAAVLQPLELALPRAQAKLAIEGGGAGEVVGERPPAARHVFRIDACLRSEEHTSELQSLMRTSYAVFCLQKKN